MKIKVRTLPKEKSKVNMCKWSNIYFIILCYALLTLRSLFF